MWKLLPAALKCELGKQWVCPDECAIGVCDPGVSSHLHLRRKRMMTQGSHILLTLPGDTTSLFLLLTNESWNAIKRSPLKCEKGQCFHNLCCPSHVHAGISPVQRQLRLSPGFVELSESGGGGCRPRHTSWPCFPPAESPMLFSAVSGWGGLLWCGFQCLQCAEGRELNQQLAVPIWGGCDCPSASGSCISVCCGLPCGVAFQLESSTSVNRWI